MRIAFLHPELGLGGAERLVVDAALHLRSAGHEVAVFTSRCDPARAFPPVADGSLDVRVHGAGIPAQVLQHLRAPSAILRMAALARASTAGEEWDVVFSDLVAHALPFLRRRTRARLVFYCHFPDRLLVPAGGLLYRLYRRPIDALEGRGLATADRLLANSRYTAARLRDAFPEVAARDVSIVSPGVDPAPADPGPPAPVIAAVGRFDPAKNLGLAVETFAALRTRLSPGAFAPLRLVIAGGYDARLAEHRRTLDDLAACAARLGVADRVDLRRSPPEAELRALLSQALCVLYTPEREHFGYVPLEAMAAGRPVIAAAEGGPTETIVDGETGFLRAPVAEAFAEAAARIVRDPGEGRRLGAAGRRRVAAHFSRAAFGRRLEAAL